MINMIGGECERQVADTHVNADHRRQGRDRARRGTNVLEAARATGHRHQRVLLSPGAADRRAVQAVPGIRREEPEAPAELPASRPPTAWWSTPSTPRVDAGAQADARVHPAQPPGRLPDLRQGRRVHAAESVLRSRQADSRVDVDKVHKPKAVDLGPTIVLDAERCILCSRCIRACDEVSGQHQLEFANRGDHEILTTAPGEQLDNPYSLNTVDVCPVGALTSKDFRFTMRAWELDATPSVCNGCATGCNIEIHHRNGARVAHRAAPQRRREQALDVRRGSPDLSRTCASGRLAVALVDGLPAGWDRAIERRGRQARGRARGRSRRGRRGAVGRPHSNEDNYALARLAKAWGATRVLRRARKRPPVPARADGKLRVADVNPNTGRRRARSPRRSASPPGHAISRPVR